MLWHSIKLVLTCKRWQVSKQLYSFALTQSEKIAKLTKFIWFHKAQISEAIVNDQLRVIVPSFNRIISRVTNYEKNPGNLQFQGCSSKLGPQTQQSRLSKLFSRCFEQLNWLIFKMTVDEKDWKQLLLCDVYARPSLYLPVHIFISQD